MTVINTVALWSHLRKHPAVNLHGARTGGCGAVKSLATSAAVQLCLLGKPLLFLTWPGPRLPFIMCLKLELSSPWYGDECY